MKPKWVTLSAKFTADEMQVINEIQRSLKLNKNQMSRLCMLMGVKALALEKQLKSTKLMDVAAPVITTMFPKKVLKEIVSKIEKKLSKIDPKIRKEALEEAKKLNKMFAVFYDHNPVGKPRQRPGIRGRPKKAGYEE